MLTIIAQQLRDYDVRGASVARVYTALGDARLLEKEFSLKGVLRSVHEYARRIIKLEAVEGGLSLDPTTGMPRESRGELFFVNRRLNKKRWA